MSALTALVRVYDQLAQQGEMLGAGYSPQKIGYLIALHEDGTPATQPIDLRTTQGRKQLPYLMAVPQAAKRASNVAPNFLWDKTAYVLGVTAGDARRTQTKHAAFVSLHTRLLHGTKDAGLRALLLFLTNWTPDDFTRLHWPEAMKDQNVVFALESERLRHVCIHDRPAAQALLARLSVGADDAEARCLVTGERGPIARLHPAIKGVWGAHSSGGSIVSFNLAAFSSYGHEQGDNAPVSKRAAFAYTEMLNRFLQKDSGHRVQIGDSSVVFWADCSNADAAVEAEGFFGSFLQIDQAAEARKVEAILKQVRDGQPVELIRPELPRGVRFYVLGLAPNAARLSVRFYLEADFGAIAERWLTFVGRLRIQPPPRDPTPPMWRLLIETASQRKSDNVNPKLAGDWLRAILTGAPYPAALLTALLIRLRADHDPNGLRAAILRAVLISRSPREEVPVSLNPAYPDTGYLLGRLFAAYEHAQTQALPGLRTTIRDQYYGRASASPRSVFPLLQRKASHHLASLRKEAPGRVHWLDKRIGEIFELADPEALFVPTLTARQQAMFAIGYYHQRNDFYRRGEPAGTAPKQEAQES